MCVCVCVRVACGVLLHVWCVAGAVGILLLMFQKKQKHV